MEGPDDPWEVDMRSWRSRATAAAAVSLLLLAAGWEGEPWLRCISTGEAMPAEFLHTLLPRVGELWNLYGPTETTIWSARSPRA